MSKKNLYMIDYRGKGYVSNVPHYKKGKLEKIITLLSDDLADVLLFEREEAKIISGKLNDLYNVTDFVIKPVTKVTKYKLYLSFVDCINNELTKLQRPWRNFKFGSSTKVVSRWFLQIGLTKDDVKRMHKAFNSKR